MFNKWMIPEKAMYPYPSPGSMNILTPHCLQKFQNAQPLFPLSIWLPKTSNKGKTCTSTTLPTKNNYKNSTHNFQWSKLTNKQLKFADFLVHCSFPHNILPYLLHGVIFSSYQCTPNDQHSLAPLYSRMVDTNPTKVYIFWKLNNCRLQRFIQ